MTGLVIDIGNTLTKIGIFDHDQLVDTEQYPQINDAVIKRLFDKYPIGKAIISTVKTGTDSWQTGLAQKTGLVYFNAAMAKGITNHYLTPGTLGLDRLAAVTGAKYSYPDSASIIVDGGTCITYDYVDAAGNYFGGSISPGLNMRYKALNYYTAGLPLIEPDAGFDNAYGTDTTTAIRSGVQNGIKHELTGFLQSYITQGGQPNILLTGGDGIFFDTLLKNSIFAPYIKNEPHLVLKGLNAAIQTDND